MSRRKVIGIDLDDVLAAFIPTFCRLANARFGRPALGTQPADWEWSNMLPDKAEQELVWGDFDKIPNVWETLDVMPEVNPRLIWGLDQKHTVYFPTARRDSAPSSTAQQSAYWIKKHFGIEFPTVVVSYEKGPLAKALKYDYFIDDRPKNCIDIKAALPDCQVFLKDSSHNQTADLSAMDIPRIAGVNEFARIILEG